MKNNNQRRGSSSVEAIMVLTIGMVAGGTLLYMAMLSCGGLCYLISLSVGSPYM